MLALVLSIPKRVLRACREEARRAFPKETVGFLIGTAGAQEWVNVDRVWFPPDRMAHMGERGWKDAPDHWFLEAEEEAGEHGLAVVGWFHTHPWKKREIPKNPSLNDTLPSPTDFMAFTWNVVALICGVRETKRGLRTRMKAYPPLRRVEMRVT